MTISELYKVLEVAVKESPQGNIYFKDFWGDLEMACDAELDEDGDLVLS